MGPGTATVDCGFARSVASMRLLTELGARHGLLARTCLAGPGVRERNLADPTNIVAPGQEMQLIRTSSLTVAAFRRPASAVPPPLWIWRGRLSPPRADSSG